MNSLTALYNLDSKAVQNRYTQAGFGEDGFFLIKIQSGNVAAGYSVLILPIGRLTVIVPHEHSRENPTTFRELEVEVEGRQTVLPSGSTAAPSLAIFDLPIG